MTPEPVADEPILVPVPPRRLLLHWGADDGCYYNRVLLPARFVGPRVAGRVRVEVCQKMPLGGPPLDDVGAAMLHGSRAGDNLALVGAWRRAGANFVWAVDDWYPDVPEWNPCSPTPQTLGAWEAVRTCACFVWCSTAAIAERANHGGARVLPNLLDLERYAVRPAPASAPPRILWQGSPTHSEDLRVAEPALRRLLAERPGRLETIFWGQCPQGLFQEFSYGGGVERHGFVPLDHYHRVLAGMRPSVVICPLIDCPFNQGKSNIKALEGLACGVPVVASDLGEYRALAGAPGLFLAATEDDWYAALSLLLDMPAERRTEIGRAGREYVEREWNWRRSEEKVHLWEQAFLEAAG